MWSAAAVLAVSSAAQAQFGLSGGMVDAFRPAFSSRDVQIAVDMLRLDETQKFIVETLFEDYETGFRTGVDGFRDKVAALRDQIDPNSPDPSQVLKAVFGSMKTWRDESKRLADTFMADLKALLNQDQLAAWPSFERKLFRLKYLSGGQLPGESLDLTTMVLDLKLDEGQADKVKPIMEQYEVQLDDALHRREQYMQTSQDALLEAIQEKNYQIGEEVADRQIELRKGVRDVNEQYTVLVAAVLPADVGPGFVRTIREQTYPRIFRKIPAERAFEAAVKIEGLDPKTQQAVESVARAFTTELDALNEHFMQLARNYKPEELKYKVTMATRQLSGADAPKLEDPTRDATARRNEIANRYMEQLKSLLAPEQFAALPGAKRWAEPDETHQLPADIQAAKERILSRSAGEGETVPRAVAPGEPAPEQPQQDESGNPE
jgi:hypothetical protein